MVAKDNTCGNSVWEAASNVARRKAQLDETGLYLSSCRHQVTQKSLNMYRGEIYAYPLLLQQHFLTRKPVLFFWQDVVCKYWPWLKHINKEVAKAITPALSVMHSKGHAWHCEVFSILFINDFVASWLAFKSLLTEFYHKKLLSISWSYPGNWCTIPWLSENSKVVCRDNYFYCTNVLNVLLVIRPIFTSFEIE